MADIGGGKKEVIASAYSVWALDGETGALLWRTGTTNNRTWPGVVLADIDKDGAKEIVVAPKRWQRHRLRAGRQLKNGTPWSMAGRASSAGCWRPTWTTTTARWRSW